MNKYKFLKIVFFCFFILFSINNTFAKADIEVFRTKQPFDYFVYDNDGNTYVLKFDVVNKRLSSQSPSLDSCELDINIKKYDSNNKLIYNKNNIINKTFDQCLGNSSLDWDWGSGGAYFKKGNFIKLLNNELIFNYNYSYFERSYTYGNRRIETPFMIGKMNLNTGKLITINGTNRIDKYGYSYYYSNSNGNDLIINKLDSNNIFLKGITINNVNFNYDYRLIELNSNVYISYIDNRTNNLALVKLDSNLNFIEEKYYQENGSKGFFKSKYIFVNGNNIGLIGFRKAGELDYISFDSNLNIIGNKNIISNTLKDTFESYAQSYGDTNFQIIGGYGNNLYIVTNEFKRNLETHDYRVYSRKVIITSISNDGNFRYSKEIKGEGIGNKSEFIGSNFFTTPIIGGNIDEKNGRLTILTKSNNTYYDKLKFYIDLQNESTFVGLNGFLQGSTGQSEIYIGDTNLDYLTLGTNQSYTNGLSLISEYMYNDSPSSSSIISGTKNCIKFDDSNNMVYNESINNGKHYRFKYLTDDGVNKLANDYINIKIYYSNKTTSIVGQSFEGLPRILTTDPEPIDDITKDYYLGLSKNNGDMGMGPLGSALDGWIKGSDDKKITNFIPTYHSDSNSYPYYLCYPKEKYYFYDGLDENNL